MIKAVIIEPEKRRRSFTPYWRNDQEIYSLFKVPVINGEFHKYWNEKIEKIFLSYAAFWSDYAQIASFVNRHKESKLYWIINDYSLRLNSAITAAVKDRDFTVIASFHNPGGWSQFIELNLNVLIFNPQTPLPFSKRKYGIIYYGMYREGRAHYFQKYFSSEIVISTSRKNIILFKQLGCKPKFALPFHWNKSNPFPQFKYSLYIEDSYSHRNYTYPANRFYEGLSCGVLQLFDEKTLPTFQKAGYDIASFIIKNKRSLKIAMSHIDKNYDHFLKQQLEWRIKAAEEREELVSQLKEIFQ